MQVDREIRPDALARARRVHAIRSIPNVTFAAMLGLNETEFYRRRDALGFRRRLGNHSAPSTPPDPASDRDTRLGASLENVPSRGGPIDRLAVGRAMERFIASRIAAYEAAALPDPEPERTARTVAHYARALGLVRDYLNDLEQDRSSEREPPARSLSELRDELRRHLERIWDEGGDVGRARGNRADPS